MTWGVTFIGQRGQFEIGLKGSLCVGISTMVVDYCQGGHGDDNGQYDEESSGRGTTAGTVFAG